MKEDKEDVKRENAKKFLENMANTIQKAYIERENEYINLMSTIAENSKYSNAIGTAMMKLPMDAQIEILKPLAKSAEISKKICERYDIEVEEE